MTVFTQICVIMKCVIKGLYCLCPTYRVDKSVQHEDE